MYWICRQKGHIHIRLGTGPKYGMSRWISIHPSFRLDTGTPNAGALTRRLLGQQLRKRSRIALHRFRANPRQTRHDSRISQQPRKGHRKPQTRRRRKTMLRKHGKPQVNREARDPASASRNITPPALRKQGAGPECRARWRRRLPDARPQRPIQQCGGPARRWRAPGCAGRAGYCPQARCAHAHHAPMDLPRFCAAPLIIYCAAKEMSHEHRQDG
jgi:hypothetical protein